ncbi:uncharacterized protein LOC130784282 isoform X1 [Actinidia eriantha]|uniref:uncharacterized protein LOC130784282 isoform X1 n=1 Tax=Actinidia eriantha TaxID=165200 RepID=UPI00258F4B2E|nr:uncharacterized protein LOC130784282 isoform X1 [Actinidia eriantha]
MAKPRKQLFFNACSVLMALLFALSASVQFNDPDWYFWFPLYAIACVVNLVNGVSTYNIMRSVSKFTLWLGFFLLFKVLIEDFVQGIAGFWSLDMRERVVREKFGSGLVISSMFLQLQASSIPISYNPTKGHRVDVTKHVKYGMVGLVGIGYGLSYGFFMFQKKEMKF